jgi:hypothetical protein
MFSKVSLFWLAKKIRLFENFINTVTCANLFFQRSVPQNRNWCEPYWRENAFFYVFNTEKLKEREQT